MNAHKITEVILEHIQKAQNSEVLRNEIYANPDIKPAKHQFLFFIKPEITLYDKNIKLPAILKMMFDKLAEFHFDITDVYILGAAYLDRFDIIAKHYGVINAMSRKPMEYLTSEGAEKFRASFGKSPDEVTLTGGLEFLKKYHSFNPVSLNELWQKSNAVKLAGGTYCAHIKVGNEEIYLVNGFHPAQLIHFTEKGRSIVTFTLNSDIDWSVARNSFIGKTNPANAGVGSLRHEILKRQEEYGLDAVNPSRNGFHLSAGPVEGLVELIRYCSDFSTGNQKKTRDFLFGRKLEALFSAEEIAAICNNAFVEYNGTKTSIFDLTEERNSDEAIKLLSEVFEVRGSRFEV